MRTTPRPLRVIQWTTGNIGKRSLHAIIARDDMELVGVYAYGYYLLAREPKRYSGFIWIALAGKTLGPLGFVYSAATGALPWSFGWICVFNDVICWPAFWRFALTHARDYRAPSNR